MASIRTWGFQSCTSLPDPSTAWNLPNGDFEASSFWSAWRRAVGGSAASVVPGPPSSKAWAPPIGGRSGREASTPSSSTGTGGGGSAPAPKRARLASTSARLSYSARSPSVAPPGAGWEMGHNGGSTRTIPATWSRLSLANWRAMKVL